MAHEGTESIEVAASPGRLLEVVTDVESYPEWMEAFQVAEVLERDDEGRPVKAEFEVDARIKVLRYTLAYTYPPDSIAWTAVSGDVEKIDGAYRFEPAGDATKVTYDYAIEPGFSVPGFLVKQGVKMMVSSALNDLKARAEG